MKDKLPIFVIGEVIDTGDGTSYEILSVSIDSESYVYGVAVRESLTDYLMFYEDMSEEYLCLEVGC